jgi:Ca-activated chloride channel family protein
MIRKTFLTLAVVFFAVLTLVIIPVNAGEFSTQGTEQQSSQYTQEAQGFNPSDAVQYAQISWPFQKEQNQGEQTQEPQNNNQSQSQGEQTQQYAQKQQPQNSNQGNQSQQEQSEQQQQSPNQNDSQGNQVNQEAQKAS